MVKIKIEARLVRREEPIVQIFGFENGPLNLDPKLLRDMLSMKISLVEEGNGAETKELRARPQGQRLDPKQTG